MGRERGGERRRGLEGKKWDNDEKEKRKLDDLERALSVIFLTFLRLQSSLISTEIFTSKLEKLLLGKIHRLPLSPPPPLLPLLLSFEKRSLQTTTPVNSPPPSPSLPSTMSGPVVNAAAHKATSGESRYQS